MTPLNENRFASELRNLIKNCSYVTNQNDVDLFSLSEVICFQEKRKCQTLYPYGFYAVAPVGSQGILLNILGNEDNQVAMPYDAFHKVKNYNPGEVVVYNPVHRNKIQFTNNGDVSVINQYGDFNVQIPSGNQDIQISGDSTEAIGGDDTKTVGGNASETVSGNSSTTVTGTLDFTATGNVTVESSSGTVTIQASSQIQLVVGGATLTLTAGSLVSSVPISAPGIVMTGGGNATMNGGNITGVGDMTTQAGKSFNNHTHSPGSFQAGGDPVTGTSGTLA